ncbi:exopolysaccharide Pel transporter PelG [Lachnobacterium bovis]|uniref:Uncharacterized membrane protein n=1 Tax=Lachnobacterium bovis TaxID=140626 RepID=A0A1H9PXX2_9FIRM|nr:exopolysaccharide Pel transporter PelG [Lachnobacterium bovis]SER53032.1 Uncharacterized membrane protein [Lachnobacterium bovis]
MAGIGFELKKLFEKKGVLSKMKAYGYTGVITTGPMLLGYLFLIGINWVGQWYNLDSHSRDLFISMITYSLFASLLFTSISSMVITRFVADVEYVDANSSQRKQLKQHEKILPAFNGILLFMLPIGGILYAIFLYFSGISFIHALLNFILFEELLVVWTQMTFLSAIKRYRAIMMTYSVAILIAFIFACLGSAFIGVSLTVLLISVCSGYGIMLIGNLVALYDYFPVLSEKSVIDHFNQVNVNKSDKKKEKLSIRDEYQGAFEYLKWFDEYKSLVVIGTFSTIGLFAHLIIAWLGPIGVHVQGLFYAAPEHDVPALFAFLTIIVTTINFVTSVEVNFYPKYARFYNLFNGQGSIKEIDQAEKEMLTVLEREIGYTAKRQLYFTAIMISVGLIILTQPCLKLGFTSLMGGYFRTLCVAYGIYAIGNVLMLMLLYFTDYKSAAIATVVFACVSVVGSCLTNYFFDPKFYGIGFAVASICYFAICLYKLIRFTNRLSYHILSRQPLIKEERIGIFTKLSHYLNVKLNDIDFKIHCAFNRRLVRKYKQELAEKHNIIQK